MANIEQFIDYQFNLGLNTDLAKIQVSDKELVEAKNVDIMPRGGISKRFGVVPVNESSYEDKVHQIIEFPRDNGNVELLALIGGELCSLAPDGTPSVIQAVNADYIPYFYLQDKFYFIDPGEEYYVYDGALCEPVTPHEDELNDLEPIKNCKYAHYHSESNRIFFAGDHENVSALYFSEFNDPTFVKGTNVVHPTRAEGRILGISVLMDAIIVGYTRGFYIWRGIDPIQDAIWEKLPTSKGIANNKSFALTTSSLSFVNKDGIYSVTPNIMGIAMENEAEEGYMNDITKDRVSKLLKECTDYNNINSVFYNRENKLLVAYSDLESGQNNKIIVTDFTNKSFSLYEGLEVNDFCEMSNGDLYLAMDNYITKLTDHSSSDFTPGGVETVINFKMKTPKYGLGNPFLRKKVHKVFVIYKNFGEVSELVLSLYIDNEKKQEWTLTGEDNNAEIITKRLKTLYSGNNFQLEIENTQYSEVEIYGIGFYYSYADTGGSKMHG